MATGTVKWFNDDKVYGFITPRTGARTSSSTTGRSAVRVARALSEGAKVEYEVDGRPKGPQARDVSVVSSV